MTSIEEFWRQYDAIEARLCAPLSERMLDLARVGAGTRLLDLATGRGEPALRAARRVGETGFVLGVDPAESMLAMTRAQAERDGLTRLELRAMPAEAVDERGFDAVTSRWGVMYMRDPVEALSRARRALTRDGAMVAALWAEPERVPYYTLPRTLLEGLRAVPPIDFEAPGTFRLAHPTRIARDFAAAGLVIEAIEEIDLPVMEVETGEALMRWSRALGLTRLLDELPEGAQRTWESRMIAASEALRQADGWIRIGGVTRLVVARRGDGDAAEHRP